MPGPQQQQQQPQRQGGQQQPPAPAPPPVDVTAPQPTARERELMRELEDLRAKSAVRDAKADASANFGEQPRITFNDGLVRVFLYVEGEGEVRPALDYLAKYADDPDPVEGEPWKPTTVLKTSEVRIDQLNETHVIVPIIRNINKDRRQTITLPPLHPDGKERMVFSETPKTCIECKPVNVTDYYKHATDRRTLGSVNRNELVNAVARACVVNGHSMAVPRVQKRNDQSGDGNHEFWLVLRWG